jgi:hypothetical protein
MKYMLMMHTPAGERDYQILRRWSPDALRAHIAFMHKLNQDLTTAGELASCEGLAEPREAKLVRAGRNGEPITDGPFLETKEFLAGYWIVDVESPERAHQIAARASTAPGPDGRPLNMAIEVRQVMQAPAPDSW